ncbi:MAG: PAS domain-containing protein [Caldilineaceae bacterium]|nr:PAS domain-containing protein [Caldilineaceae bacterium]
MRVQAQLNPITAKGQFSRGQGKRFLFLFFLLAILSPTLFQMSWRISPSFHTLLDALAALLASIVALFALIYHRHSRRDAQFLFVAIGFVGVALLDTLHMALTSATLAPHLPSPLSAVAPWSWLITRLVLAGFFLLNAATLSKERARNDIGRVRMPQLLLLVGMLAFISLFIILFIPLPQAIFFAWPVPRPQEFLVAIPLALAFVLYYAKRHQVQDPLFQWVLASIVVNLAIQLFWMPWSKTLYDPAFTWAHLGRIVSYVVVLVGVAYGVNDIIDQLRHNRDEIKAHNVQLATEIAERQKAEWTIRLYQKIVENMQSGVFVYRLEDPADLGSFRFVLVNHGAEVATGQSSDFLLNRRIDEVVPAMMGTEYPLLYKQVLDTQEPYNLGDLFYVGDGIEEYFSTWLIPLDAHHLAAIFENISERKRMEDALRKRQDDFNEAQAIAHVGSWVWDIETGTLTWSDELYRIYGYRPGELQLTYENYIRHIHPDDRQRVQDRIAQAMRGDGSYESQHRIVTSQGDVRIIEARGHMEMSEGENGERRAVRMWGTGQDVTEQRLLEETRRRNEIKLAQALNLSQIGHWDWELATSTILISTELAPIFGYGKEAVQISFDEFMQLIRPDERSHTEKNMREAIAQRALLWTRFYIVRADGSERGIECIGTPVMDDSGNAVSMWGTGQDITERLLLESQLRQYAAQLEVSNRDLQDFAYIASHDLQEPLRKISTFSNRLVHMNRDTLDEKSLDYFNRMQDAAKRMQRLINDLLTLSRVSTRGQPLTEIDLNLTIQGVLRDLEAQIESTGGSIDVARLPAVKADHAQMQQLFQNLISNALKFHRPEKAPSIRIYPLDPAASDERIQGITAIIVVEDNGIGFETRYVDKIFQPFQRLHSHKKYEGTGMGLAICRKIMERHGGSIVAESTPGKGSRFILTFSQATPRDPPTDALSF